VDLRNCDERIVTLVAMLVTLTPGTLALDYEPRSGRILVHALDTRSPDETERSVRAIERRLLAWIHAGAGTPGEGTDER
jgi:multicomponent Na+:H+ antiporter subunit E